MKIFKSNPIYTLASKVLVIAFILFAYQVNAQWVQKGTNINGTAAYYGSGADVSLSGDGNIMAIGEPAGNPLLEQVRVFEWSGTDWEQRGAAILCAAPHHDFATSIAIDDSGNTIIIGAPQVYSTGSGVGYAQVWIWDGVDWVQRGQNVVGSISTFDDHVGCDVDISADGNTIVVGAYGSDLEIAAGGACSLYTWDGSGWIQKGEILAGNGGLNWFGYSVSLSADGNVVAVGAYGYNFTPTDALGQVKIFEWTGMAWILRGTPINGNIAEGKVGATVCLSDTGDHVVVGTEDGNALVYHWSGVSWAQEGSTIQTDGSGLSLTSFVDINANGSIIAVGIPAHDGVGDLGSHNAGQVKTYSWNGTEWVQMGEALYGGEIFEGYGSAVNLSNQGNILAIGTPGNTNNGINSGYTRVWEYQRNPIPGVTLYLSALLEGPYHYINFTHNMTDHLRELNSLPTNEPFTALGFAHYGTGGGEVIADGVLDIFSNNAIVDWIFVEIRNGNNPSQILATKSALIQVDGDIVGMDGNDGLFIEMTNVPPSIVIVLRHRNHFGVRTANAYNTAASIAVDFTNMATPLFGANPTKIINGVQVLIAGDANIDGQINSIDMNEYWRIQNSAPYNYIGSSADFNFDGTVNGVDKNIYLRINTSLIEQL